MYGFDYFHEIVFVILYRAVNTIDVTTLLNDGITAGGQVLNEGAKAKLLHGRHRLETVRQPPVEEDRKYIQQYIKVVLLVTRDRVSSSDAEVINLRNLPKMINDILL